MPCCAPSLSRAFLVGGGHGEAPTKDNQDPIDLYTQSLNSNIKLQDLLALHSEQWEMIWQANEGGGM